MARSRYKFVKGIAPHFLTGTTVNWTPVFSSKAIAEILLGSMRFLQNEERWIIYAYVILENHIHWIASSPDLSQSVASFKSFTAKRIIEFLEERNAVHVLHQLQFFKLLHKTDRTYQLWQEGSHPEMIQGDAMMRQKIEYIHNNPVMRGYVDLPVHWRHSSARNYAGMEGVLEVTTTW
ncbi:MAG: transposase [Caldilineaceae bacterium]